MTKSILRLSLLGLLAIGIAGLPHQLRAQDASAADSQPAKRLPFHGALKAVDQNARTISVGTLTIHSTAETKIVKDGKPATLQDGVVGEPVGGSYRKTDDGKLEALLIRFGAKAETEAKAKTKKEKE